MVITSTPPSAHFFMDACCMSCKTFSVHVDLLDLLTVYRKGVKCTWAKLLPNFVYLINTDDVLSPVILINGFLVCLVPIESNRKTSANTLLVNWMPFALIFAYLLFDCVRKMLVAWNKNIFSIQEATRTQNYYFCSDHVQLVAQICQSVEPARSDV